MGAKSLDPCLGRQSFLSLWIFTTVLSHQHGSRHCEAGEENIEQSEDAISVDASASILGQEENWACYQQCVLTAR